MAMVVGTQKKLCRRTLLSPNQEWGQRKEDDDDQSGVGDTFLPEFCRLHALNARKEQAATVDVLYHPIINHSAFI